MIVSCQLPDNRLDTDSLTLCDPMATLLSRSVWAKISVFRKKMAFFSFKTYLYWIFWLEYEISASELTPVPNFSPIGQKIRELEFWPGTIPKTASWRHTYLLVMTSAKFLRLLRDFVLEYHHAKFGSNWTTIKEKQRGALYSPQLIWFQKTPAWIGSTPPYLGDFGTSCTFQIWGSGRAEDFTCPTLPTTTFIFKAKS